MGLFEDLRKLSEQVKEWKDHIHGEEATRHSLILPFLQVLGFSVHNPHEVKPEYFADFALNPRRRVDYALYVKGELSIFVECKAVDVAVEDHQGQLALYFNSTPSVKLGVITNGIQYRFYTDLRLGNVMDGSPFFEFNILSFTEHDAELLRAFTKDAFNSQSVNKYAEEIISTEKVTSLIGELLTNPSDNFVKFIIKEKDLVAGNVMPSVIQRFMPIVKKAMQTTLLELMTKSFQQGLSPQTVSPAVAPLPAAPLVPQPATTAQPPSAAKSTKASESNNAHTKPVVGPEQVTSARDGSGNSSLVTTEEELSIFQIVSRICGESSLKSEVKYKDTTAYFGINIGVVTRWFLRVFTNSSKKSVVTRLAPTQAAMYAPGFSVDSPPDNYGASRVYFNTSADFERLRTLIIHAYEYEVKRLKSGIADTDESAG